jgi:hypothetical protein
MAVTAPDEIVIVVQRSVWPGNARRAEAIPEVLPSKPQGLHDCGRKMPVDGGVRENGRERCMSHDAVARMTKS